METTQFQVTPEQAKDEAYLRTRIAKELGIASGSFTYRWKKRSIDARKRQIKINCSFSSKTPIKPVQSSTTTNSTPTYNKTSICN